MRVLIKLYLFVLSLSVAASLSASEPDPSLCETAEQEIAPIFQPMPSYPQHASLLCLEGWVRAEFTVGMNGDTLNIKVVDSEPAGVFDTAAEQISQWRFRPACKEGVPVERKAMQQLDFSLPPEIRSVCPAQMDEKTLNLFIELAAFYGNIAEQLMLVSPGFIELPLKETQAVDDFGLIKQFHLQTMKQILSLYSDGEDEQFQARYLNLFDAQRIANDINFEQTDFLFDEFREQAWANSLRPVELFDQIRTDVQLLRNNTDLSEELFYFLVERFHGGFSGPDAEAFLAEQRETELLEDEALNDLRSALELLHSNRQSWQPSIEVPNYPAFNDESLQLEYMNYFSSTRELARIGSENRAALIQFWAAEP